MLTNSLRQATSIAQAVLVLASCAFAGIVLLVPLAFAQSGQPPQTTFEDLPGILFPMERWS